MKFHRDLVKLLALCVSALFMSSGCVALVAPKYNASFSNVQTLREKNLKPLKVGAFTAKAAEGHDVNRLTIRGAAYSSPNNNSFVSYLQEALRQELYDARLFDETSTGEITGFLVRNSLDASGISVGIAEIEARFVVSDAGTSKYDKVFAIKHEWPSAFMAANAVPLAQENYPIAVQKLLEMLFNDSNFIGALKK